MSVARLRFAPPAALDLERLAAFLEESDPAAAVATIGIIIEAVEILARHPMIGRPLENGSRELVIHRGSTGYLAQYRYDIAGDEVVLLGIRHQREVDPEDS